MRRRLTLPLMVLHLAACFGGESAPPPVEPEGDSSALRVLGGPPTCDSCESVVFSVKGAGLEDVIEARLVRQQGRPDVELPASVELRRFTGDSGRVLQVTVRIAGPVLAGVYDLRLRPLEADRELVVSPALYVSRSWVPPGGTPPIPSGVGVLQLTVVAVGEAIDSSFTVEFTASFGTRTQDVRPGEPLTLAAAAGPLRLRLVNLALNCELQPPSEVTVSIVAGASTPASLTVRCFPPSYLRLTLAATGADLPRGVSVGCDDSRCDRGFMASNAVQLVRAGIGPVTVRPQGLQYNCRMTSADAITLAVTPGDTTDAAFAITCLPFGIVRISVQATGPGAPASFRVMVVSEVDCGGWYTDCYFDLPVRETLEYRPYAGRYDLSLTALPSHCTQVNPTPPGVVSPGETVAVEFAVTCR